MGEIEGTTINVYLGRWALLYNRRCGWREWSRTAHFIVGLSVGNG